MATSTDVTAGTNATATQYNNLRGDWLLGRKTLTTVADAATMTFNLAVSNFFITGALTDNRTFAFSNIVTGQPFTIIVLQDGTGSRTITWPANVKWMGGVAPTTSGANAYDVFTLVRVDGTNYLGFFNGFNFS